MQGRRDEALEMFVRALTFAGRGRDPELCAQCNMNIGDWYRKVTKDLEKARKYFDSAALLAKSLVTKSRLCSMRAMAEEGSERIRILKRAMSLAKQGYEEDPEAARKAKFFALHRLCGFVGEEGTAEQKQEILQMIEEFLPELPVGDAEVARLNYTKALIIAPERQQEAITLLEGSARRLWDESPGDAVPYLIYAARIAVDCGDITKARGLVAQAEQFRDILDQSEDGRKYVAMLGEVKQRI